MTHQVIHFGEIGDIVKLFKSIDPQHSQVATLIIGNPGDGKSSLATACGLENMSFEQIFNYQDACAKIDYLNTHKRANFQYPHEKHLVFATGLKISKPSHKMTSYDFDPWRTGLNDPTYATQYFPKHSIRVYDEIQKYFPSQQDVENSKMPLRVSTELQKDRHYDIHNIGTAQVGTDINKKLRDISSFILTKSIKFIHNKYNIITHTVWETVYFVNHFAYDAYLASNGDEECATKRVKFMFHSNIGLHYDHTSCEKEFDEVDNKYCSYDQGYEVPNSLIPPEGYSKKVTNRKGVKSDAKD